LLGPADFPNLRPRHLSEMRIPLAQPVLVAGARTPIGRLVGSLATIPVPALAGAAIRAALERAGITGDQVI
jgi:acetyl-CoA C-acetyltransferase